MKKVLSRLKNYVFQSLVNDDIILKKYQIYKQENKNASTIKVLLYLIKTKFTNKPENKITTNTNIKEPFIGIESSISNRVIPTISALLLSRNDIISFSIFDTLIFIPFNHKYDIYWLLESKLNIVGFRQFRINAEQKLALTSNNYSIEDIYNEISNVCSLDIEHGIKTEIELWKQLIYPNKYMNIIFNILVEQGKKVVLIEDTFFTKNTIINMLNKCGYKEYAELFISSEMNYSKKNGTIYSFIKDKFCNTSIIHIGNDFANDSKAPRENGIETKYYNSCSAYGMKHRATGINPLYASAYSALVNQKLHKNDKIYNQFYELGYIYGGFCILGYTNFLLEYCSNHCIDRVIFASSNGSFIKSVFDTLSDGKISSAEVLWNTSLHKYFNNGNADNINNAVINYIIPLINEYKNILIVDSNFSGIYSLDLRLIINKISSNIQCHCVLFANPSHALPYVLNKNTSAYLFDNHTNMSLYHFHKHEEYSLILQLFIQNKQAELKLLKEMNSSIQFEFNEPNIEYYNIIEETHNGIMDFIVQYTELFKQNKFMYDICGYDAYMPLKFLFSNKSALKYYIDAIKSCTNKV